MLAGETVVVTPSSHLETVSAPLLGCQCLSEPQLYSSVGLQPLSSVDPPTPTGLPIPIPPQGYALRSGEVPSSALPV